MSQVVNSLDNLRLENLSEEWVNYAFNSEFLEFEDITDYQGTLDNVAIQEVFQNVIVSIDDWLTEDSTEEEKSWALLSRIIKYKKLLSLLAYYIDYGCKNILTKQHRDDALIAAQLYYKLLTIPGYKAYDVYHSQLFAHALICLSFPKVLYEKENQNQSKRDLANNVNIVIKKLRTFAEYLKDIVETLRLGPSDMNYEDILTNLLEIPGGCIVNKLNIDKIEFSGMTKIIYDVIERLICNTNGDPNTEAIGKLFKCLLPKLVEMSDHRVNSVVRASYVTYTGLLLIKYGKYALPGFNLLLQHLCFSLDSLDRSEVRNGRVSLIEGLMNLLPSKTFNKFVNWLIKLSSTIKVPHRQVAVELLHRLLAKDPEESSCNEQQNNDEESIPSSDEDSQDFPEIESDESEMGEAQLRLLQPAHRVRHAQLLRALHERVHDAAGPLRARALTVLAECVEMRVPHIQEALIDLNGNGEVSRLMALCARCICDERALVRRAAIIFILRLLSSRTLSRPTDDPNEEDTKSDVDVEIANLTDNAGSTAAGSTSNTINIDDGPSTSKRMDVSNTATTDAPSEANTASGSGNRDITSRRNENNTGYINYGSTARPVVRSDYALLVAACRDGTVMVRASAITAVGELASSRPSELAFDAFLSGPIHHLSDTDPKVAELVASLVQDLIINRLNVYKAHGTEDRIPWMFLESIIRHNMRRHLQKACGLLHKISECIKCELVDVLRTHLGALNEKRDLQCLVLLTCVAKHVEYSDPKFFFSYFYKIDDEIQAGDDAAGVRDGRVHAMALELCGTWARWRSPKKRAALRARLVRRVGSAPNDECRIACAALAAQLDPNDLQWALDLMHLSERRALQGGGVAEWVRAADLSLVAPEPPSADLLRLFLSALANPPSGWSEAERAACVAGAGRLCLRARPAAAACAPLLAALLRDGAQPAAARLNALRACADMCTRYTCIMDPLMVEMRGCLAADTPVELRRYAVRAFTRLLLAGFLRLRPTLYYVYCALLADDDYDVREPVEYYVTQSMSVDTLYAHFVECLRYYSANNIETLKSDDRQLIYDVMLQRMSPVQLLNTQCKLAQEVLVPAAEAAEAAGQLPPELHAATLDCVKLFCGPRMRLPSKNTTQPIDPGDIEVLQEKITTNIVSHRIKAMVAEVVVPTVMRLYTHMRTSGDELVSHFVQLITNLLADYRSEIEEAIKDDEELVERVNNFQETMGLERSFGNARNLVVESAPPSPDTPRTRKRPQRVGGGHSAPKKRLLNM